MNPDKFRTLRSEPQSPQRRLPKLLIAMTVIVIAALAFCVWEFWSGPHSEGTATPGATSHSAPSK